MVPKKSPKPKAHKMKPQGPSEFLFPDLLPWVPVPGCPSWLPSGEGTQVHHLCRKGEVSAVLSWPTEGCCTPSLKLTSPYILSLSAETPLSLSQLCRVSLRRRPGRQGLEKIARLDIPPRLIDFPLLQLSFRREVQADSDSGRGGFSASVCRKLCCCCGEQHPESLRTILFLPSVQTLGRCF